MSFSTLFPPQEKSNQILNDYMLRVKNNDVTALGELALLFLLGCDKDNIKVNKNLGIKWLFLGSEKGDKCCSLELVKIVTNHSKLLTLSDIQTFFEKEQLHNDCDMMETTIRKFFKEDFFEEKIMNYFLKIAIKQNSNTAKQIFSKGSIEASGYQANEFGLIFIEENNSVENKLL